MLVSPSTLVSMPVYLFSNGVRYAVVGEQQRFPTLSKAVYLSTTRVLCLIVVLVFGGETFIDNTRLIIFGERDP